MNFWVAELEHLSAIDTEMQHSNEYVIADAKSKGLQQTFKMIITRPMMS